VPGYDIMSYQIFLHCRKEGKLLNDIPKAISARPSPLSPDSYFTLLSGTDSMDAQPPHTQVGYELQYVVSGQGYVHINNKKMFLSVGDYVILTPGDQHSLKPKNSIRYFSLEFSIRDAFRDYPLYEELSQIFDQPGDSTTIILKNTLMKFLLENLFKEWQEQKAMYTHQISLIFQQILTQCSRDYHSGMLLRDLDGSEKDKILDTFFAFIQAYMGDPGVLNLFEKNYGIKRETLSLLTKQVFNKTVFQLYTEKRFEYAQNLLAEGRVSITDIAEKCAFSSVSAFSKAFTKYCGMSPSRYIRLHAPLNSNTNISTEPFTSSSGYIGAEFSKKHHTSWDPFEY